MDKKADDTFWTVLTDGSEEVDEALEKIAADDTLIANGVLDDGILITGQPTGLVREGLTNACDDEDDTDDEDINNDTPSERKCDSGRHVYGITEAMREYESTVKLNLVDSLQKESGCSKRPPILTADRLLEQNKRALIIDPNYSGKRKLCQLERHQRLHILYEAGKIRKCLLSYFLLVAKDRRLKLLRWMGSKLAEHIDMPALYDIEQMPLRLAKIPADYSIGGDKGFTGIEHHLPNCNCVEYLPKARWLPIDAQRLQSY